MAVLIFVCLCFSVIGFLLGRARRLNRSIQRGDALINLDTGEVIDRDSRAYRREVARGRVKFKLD